MTATKQKPSKETLCAVLTALTTNPVLAHAMKLGAPGYRGDTTIFQWAQASRAGDPRFADLRWPSPEGEPITFHSGIVQARQIFLAHGEALLRRDALGGGTPRVLRNANGDVVFEQDYKMIADFEGNADEARALGNVDPFYVHDASGARVPVIVHDQAPAALRQHVARSLLAGYNPSDRREVDARHSGGVMIIKATQQGASNKQAPPPYSREAMAAAQAEPVSDLKADLLRRLEDLRQRGPTNPRPQRPVSVGGYSRTDDPAEGGA